jgi:hypothetical protein
MLHRLFYIGKNKQMRITIIAFTVLLIILSNCKKDDKENINLPYTEVFGIVVSTGSQQPVDSVRVSI